MTAAPGLGQFGAVSPEELAYRQAVARDAGRVAALTKEDVLARVDRRGLAAGGCWLWTGSLYSDGYAKWRGTLAHRLAYRVLVGPIPPGRQLDHTCHNKASEAGLCAGGTSCEHRRCVNPEHLEAVTAATNTQRMWAAKSRLTDHNN